MADETYDKQSIDIESMKVKLLIVCREKNRLDAVAMFLNRRGWEVQVTTKIKDALAMVSTSRPDFVMVSANHPNPKLGKLPFILKNNFQVPSIGYTETGDSKSLGVLQRLGTTYIMHGRVSGPNTQRRIKQILREIFFPETQRPERKALGRESDENIIITQKGGMVGEDGGLVAIKGDRGPQAAGRGLGYAHGSSDHLHFADEFGDDDFDGISAEVTLGVESGEVEKRPPIEATFIPQNLQLSPQEIAAIVEGVKSDVAERDAAKPKGDFYFEKLVIKLLNDLTNRNQAVERRIGKVDRIVIVSVKSPTTNGYLVLATSAPKRALRELSVAVRAQLNEFLRQEGKSFEFGPPTLVFCSAHDFLATRENYEFLHVTGLDNGEIAVKFLIANKPPVETPPAGSDEKLRLKSEAIPPQRPVDFKVFIHLQKNDRYIVLVKEGGALNEKYSQRLKQYDKDLFINEMDGEKFQRFCSTVRALELLGLESYRVEYAETGEDEAA